MRARGVAILLVAVAVLALAAAPAAAAAHGLVAVPMGVFGIDFPSVKSIVSDVVKFFFTTFLDALVPDWLSHGSVQVIRRLVTVPNPTDQRVWPTLGRLSDGMRWIALPLLSLAAVASWVQQWLRELTGRPGSVASVLPRTVLAALLLAVYPVLVSNAVALVNSVTNAMLSLPVVEHGLQRTVGLVFAGTLLSGDELLLVLLGIAAVLLAVGLFMLSVGLLTVFAIAFVSAPLAIACSVLDETRGIWTAWRYTLLSAGLIPVGWCVLFSTAGAFMLDMTTWSGGIAGTLGARLVGVFAALIILWLAVRWPLMLWGTLRTHLGGALLSVGRAGAYGRPTGSQQGGRVARAALQRTSLRAGQAVSGALGATRGRAATSARMALTGGARLAARVPGAGPVLAAGAGAVAAVGSRLAPVSARAGPAGRAVGRAAAQARTRVGAAAGASKAALARGATSREAASVGVAALARPARSASTERPGAPARPGGDGRPRERVEAGASSPGIGPGAQRASAAGASVSRASPKQRTTRPAAASYDGYQLVVATSRRPDPRGATSHTATAPARRPGTAPPAGGEPAVSSPASARPVPPAPVPPPRAPAPRAARAEVRSAPPGSDGSRRPSGRPGPRGR